MSGEGTGTVAVTPGPIILSTFNSRVDQLLKDDAVWVSSDEIDDHITAAAKLYSLHRPLVKVDEFVGDGGYDYDLPSDWVQGFSLISRIEYPYDEQEITIIPKEEWTIFLKLVGSTQTYVLRFLDTSPAASYSIRVNYTLPHTINGSTSTVYQNDVEAVCHLAASMCLQAIASKMLQTSSPTIGADAVSYAAKSSAASTRAKEYYKFYLLALGLDGEIAALGIKEFDTGFSWDAEHLTHKSWNR